MADKDLFAPLSKDEIKSAQGSMRVNEDLFAPLSKEEIQQASAPTSNDPLTVDRLMNPTHEDKAKGLEGLGRMADYGGGLMRTGIASSAGLLSGRGILPGTQPVVSEEDVLNAFKGNAPKSSEYMAKAGIPEGPTTEKIPVLGNLLPRISARDAAGFVADAVTDPITHAEGAGAKAISPLSEGAEAGGKSMYKSGFKKIDERLAETGEKPLSDVLLENGAPTGTTKQIAEESGKIAKKLGNERSAAYDTAKSKGVTADLEFPLPNAEAELAKIRANPTKKSAKLADDLEDMMNDYKSNGKVDLDKLSDWKTGLYDELPDSAFSGAKVKKSANRFQKALAKDFKETIEEGANTAQSGLGDKVKNINENLGSIISSEKPTKMQIRRGETPNVVSSVDAILSGHPGLLLAKKSADAAKTTYLRTKAGKGLMQLGRTGMLDAGARRGLLNNSSQQSPGLLKSRDGLLSGDE